MCIFLESINPKKNSLKKLFLEIIIGLKPFSVFTMCQALCWRWLDWDMVRNKIDMTPDLMELVVYPLTGEQVIGSQGGKCPIEEICVNIRKVINHIWEVKESNPYYGYLKIMFKQFH